MIERREYLKKLWKGIKIRRLGRHGYGCPRQYQYRLSKKSSEDVFCTIDATFLDAISKENRGYYIKIELGMAAHAIQMECESQSKRR